jgi:hypothetical protein
VQAAIQNGSDRQEQDWAGAIPLYLASCVVTLAGVGAVGVTITDTGWTPVWAVLTIVGHIVSAALRRAKVAPETVFYPVMILGSAFVLQQALLGSPLVGLQTGLAGQPPDMATALIVAMLAVLRTFTLVTNTSLLFSPVPPITMLALVGSSNPNAEVPLFFGLSLLGSLFITGYEAHVRRSARMGRANRAATLHLLTAWGFTLAVAGAALAFPLLIQPVFREFSPFVVPMLNRRLLQNFTNNTQNQAPVGQGPIQLSQSPVYEVYTEEPGKLRTGVFSRYTGREWRADPYQNSADITAHEKVEVALPLQGSTPPVYEMFRHPVPQRSQEKARPIRQFFVTQGYGQAGIPASGTISEVHYPMSRLRLHGNGTVSGDGHRGPNVTFEVLSRVRDYAPEELRAAPPVDLASFSDPESLELPNSALPVSQLAREVTHAIANPYDRVTAIIAYIEKNCTYTLQEEVTPPGVDATAHYLFKSKRGACDLAATATAVMCRSVGIPARVAVGYVLEEQLPSGGFIVRQAHSHMWVEAFFAGLGWVPFDPAPSISSIKENALASTWYRLRGAFAHIGGGGLDAVLLLVVVVTTLAMVGYAGWTWFRLHVLQRIRSQRTLAATPGGVVALTYARALRLLDNRGWRREPWMTPREYLASLREPWSDAPEAVQALEALTQLYEQSQYATTQPEDGPRLATELLVTLTRFAPARKREKQPRPAAQPAIEGTA